MKFNLKPLSYIEAAANHGSIAKAAQSMRISKSSISAAIDAFEADFGISLFLRQPSKGLDLTAGGRRAMDDLRHLLQQARQME